MTRKPATQQFARSATQSRLVSEHDAGTSTAVVPETGPAHLTDDGWPPVRRAAREPKGCCLHRPPAAIPGAG